MPPEKMPAKPLTVESVGPPAHTFIPAPASGWDKLAVMEWEMRGESWTDLHPHDEVNYVLEGHLFVSCDGVTVEARQGDVVRVPAGTAGKYWAPVYARMLGIYAPNPTGLPTTYLGHERLDSAGVRQSGK
jgi:uncharacterized cupin superfamily protein